MSEGVTFTSGNRVLDVKTHILPTDPAIQGIQIMADGSIWVSSCYADRELPEGIFRRYDVFAPSGEPRAEVRIACDVDREEDSLLPLENGNFLWIKNATSATNAMYAGLPGSKEDDAARDEDEDVMLEVIYLARTR